MEIIEEAEDAPLNSDTTPVRTWFGGCGQDTGSTDTIDHDTGRTDFKSETGNHGTCGV